MVKQERFCFVFQLKAPQALDADGGGGYLPERGPAEVSWGWRSRSKWRVRVGLSEELGRGPHPRGGQRPRQRQATW